MRTLQGVSFHPVKQEQGSLGNQTKALFSGRVWCSGAKDHGISDLEWHKQLPQRRVKGPAESVPALLLQQAVPK